MPKQKIIVPPARLKTWPLLPAATFGLPGRANGILLEVRARLPLTVRKSLNVDGMALVLGMACDHEQNAYHHASGDKYLLRKISDSGGVRPIGLVHEVTDLVVSRSRLSAVCRVYGLVV